MEASYPSVNPGRQMLIVEDDPNLRESLAEQLRLHEEFDIGEAGSGGEAIERAKSQRFDLVLLDVGLPDMDGREVLLDEVWAYNAGVITHTLETHIYGLRQKIENDPSRAVLLVTESGGYRLVS